MNLTNPKWPRTFVFCLATIVFSRLLYQKDLTALFIPLASILGWYGCFVMPHEKKIGRLLLLIVVSYLILAAAGLLFESYLTSVPFDALFWTIGASATTCLYFATYILRPFKINFINVLLPFFIFPFALLFAEIWHHFFPNQNKILPYFYMLIVAWNWGWYLSFHINYTHKKTGGFA